MPKLKVVALISGGKDSFFSILHCIANGHEVVALANLYPALQDGQHAIEDLESYMYQTIGHAVIPLYEQALGLPLFRQQILGGAVNQDKSYGVTNDSLSTADQDETESLMPLLRKVMDAHPEVNAVSTGAILSEYQRTRVESVALRLSLTPLSYLWQWPNLPPCIPSSLLQDMADVGQDSRIIKVASGGLDDTFLWEDVASPQTVARLTRAAARFGTADQGATLGEGGEYETLAISGPAPLWKARIMIDEEHRVVTQGDAGSSSLRLELPYIAPLDSTRQSTQSVRVPALLEQRFERILASLREQHASALSVVGAVVSDQPLLSDQVAVPCDTNNGGSQERFLSGLTGQGDDAADQTRAIMEQLSRELADLQHELSDIAYTSIILRNMADFPSVNRIYGRHFSKPNPPARVTIACADVLTEGCLVMISVTSSRNRQNGSRQALHVQSRSYWAPANIGPYSQAVSVPAGTEQSDDRVKMVYIAGQIPLVPASMDLPSSDVGHTEAEAFELQTVLALQHMSRVGEVMNVVSWAAAIAFVTIDEMDQCSTRVRVIRSAWEAMHRSESKPDDDEEHDDSFDVWYASSTRGIHHTPGVAHRYAIRDGRVPPLYVVRVDSLPRGCSVEWASYGIEQSSDHATDTELTHMRHLINTFRHRML